MPRSPWNNQRCLAWLMFGALTFWGASAVAAEPGGVPLQQLRVLFQRPATLPVPTGADAEQMALGARLFGETALSANQKMSCATCHNPARGFIDGRRTAHGNTGQILPRNTPALWNLGDARAFYWDGRSPTLEAQAKDAIERDGEMAASLEVGVQRLSQDPHYVAAFQRAFPGATAISGEHVLAALARYERTLNSPDTRFDRWVGGADDALTLRELAGLQVFSSKGRCLACHGGWRFTDDRFHDIGLQSSDPGRGAIVGGSGRSFKTPSLREIVWTAPYMHDGSLRTLDEVVGHYAGKLEYRGSLASELKRGIVLSRSERRSLVAFLKTLSSTTRPRTPPLPRG
jgi:cytochrome c peroxidase